MRSACCRVSLPLLVLLQAAACGPSSSGNDNLNLNLNNQNGACAADTDGDGLCDDEEGRAEDRDTDGDGTPDYLDLDSDGDGIPDTVERGEGETPADSDFDGTPDYLETDSDGNGLPDAVEGLSDQDGDGLPAYRDRDDDDDGIVDAVELGDVPTAPRDTDGDGTPDFRDPDSDGDGIPDAVEGDGGFLDSDGDGLPDYRDPDSDGDGIPDAVEAGPDADDPRDADGDAAADYVDVDSDNDGLVDGVEDVDADGVVDPGETEPRRADTDGDGADDLVETAAGTDPLDPLDSPATRGDLVFVLPHEAAPAPGSDRVALATTFQALDLYILEDVSASMGEEMGAVKASLLDLIDSIVCGPGDDPAQDFCVPDVQTGAGIFGRTGQVWEHLKDIDDNLLLTQAVLPTTADGGNEQHLQALAGAVTDTCVSDPTRRGRACFRTDALGVLLLITDEDLHEDAGWGLPAQQTTYDAVAGLGVRVVGITGYDTGGERDQLRADLLAMAGGSPAVDLVPALASTPFTTQCNGLGGAPFFSNRAIVDGADAQAADAIACALQAITSYLPQDVTPTLVNDPANVTAAGDPLDAVATFVDTLATDQQGTLECSTGHAVADQDGDGANETYLDIYPGSRVCWTLSVRSNTTVSETPTGPQLFRAFLELHGEGGALLDRRTVFFVVPPLVEGPGGPG